MSSCFGNSEIPAVTFASEPRKRRLSFFCGISAVKKSKEEEDMNQSEISNAVKQIFTKAKKEFSAMVGAIRHAENQLQKIHASEECVGCTKAYENRSAKENTMVEYKSRIRKARDSLESSRPNEKRKRCLELNKQLKLNMAILSDLSEADIKLGRALAIRSQKQKALLEKKCTICHRDLNTVELGVLLSAADRSLSIE